MILLHVDRHPGASQDSIANHMYIDKCNVARRTKKLEELGYIRRETDQGRPASEQSLSDRKGPGAGARHQDLPFPGGARA